MVAEVVAEAMEERANVRSIQLVVALHFVCVAICVRCVQFSVPGTAVHSLLVPLKLRLLVTL